MVAAAKRLSTEAALSVLALSSRFDGLLVAAL